MVLKQFCPLAILFFFQLHGLLLPPTRQRTCGLTQQTSGTIGRHEAKFDFCPLHRFMVLPKLWMVAQSWLSGCMKQTINCISYLGLIECVRTGSWSSCVIACLCVCVQWRWYAHMDRRLQSLNSQPGECKFTIFTAFHTQNSSKFKGPIPLNRGCTLYFGAFQGCLAKILAA